jgi:hypothetical protein
VTIEFQRAKAKELSAFFREQQYEKSVEEGKAFGWTPRKRCVTTSLFI